MNKLTDKIKERAREYGSIPFWSWNDRLSDEELVRQIHNMKDMEMGGFFMHARGGLETEYMSEEWYDKIKLCVEEAKKLGMEAWSYDENGWPSGFAGGKLLEDSDNFAVFIEGELFDIFPNVTENTVAVYSFDKKGVPHLTDASVDGCEKYLSVTVGYDSSYVDTMRADITKKFIAETHEDYKRRLGEDFGAAMPGFFTDEPQYYRWKTPYSTFMDSWFMEEYGYSVKKALPALFCDYEGAEEYRYDYHRMTFKKFTEGFSKTLYDWHEANGVRLTGHFVEESTLQGQMMCCGDIMPQYLYEHIPGIDYLGRALKSDVAPKQLGSVCAQTGRKKALSEMFGCCGWDVSPKELKSIAELQYANGVNVMCQHLYPYSIRGQRKRDYPAFYSDHNLWQKGMRDFDRYFNNLGSALSLGEEYADILVIHPMHSAWLTFKRIKMRESVEQLDKDLEELTDLLSGNQIAYHFGSETIMAGMASVHGDTLSVGLCTYKTVIIPALDTLDAHTVKLLKEFKSNGGHIYTFKHHLPTRIDGRTDDLSFLSDCEDISDKNIFKALKEQGEVVVNTPCETTLRDLRMMVRKTEYGKLIYLANLSNKDIQNIRVSVNECGKLGNADIMTLNMTPVRGKAENGCTEVLVDLYEGKSVLLCEYEAPSFLPLEESNKSKDTIKLTSVTLKSFPENMMTLDRACVSLNGEAFSELKPIEQIRDELLQTRFNGQLTLRFPFSVKELPGRLKVVTEPCDSNKITVNGETVNIGKEYAIDKSFRMTDIGKQVKVGENYVEMTLKYWQSDYVYYVLFGGVSETLRNCLVFDTEIENVYLMGDFCLDMKVEDFKYEENNACRYDSEKGMALVRQRESVNPGNIVTDGYPFCCGEITFAAKISYKRGDPTILYLNGRYSTASVSVNGESAGNILFVKYLDLAEYLREGDNEISITLCNNYRNLLGPHHFSIAEPLSVSPKHFSFENQWNDGVCEKFDKGYSFVRFGIDLE